MIYQKQTLAVHNGILCVKYQSTLNDKPAVAIRYWPITEARNYSPELIAQMVNARPDDLLDNRQNGSYSFREAPYRWVDLRLKDGGKTIPIHTEEYPLPAPKARTEVRWHDGRYQKFLKSSGWVDIPIDWQP